MATMLSEVYDAFLNAGADQEKARKAAEAIATYESRSNTVEQKLVQITGELNLIKWMLGFVLAGVGALIVKALFP